MNDELPKIYVHALEALATIQAKHPEKEDAQGEIDCPACRDGKIKYTVSGYNGHVWAKCTTPDCIRFIQ